MENDDKDCNGGKDGGILWAMLNAIEAEYGQEAREAAEAESHRVCELVMTGTALAAQRENKLNNKPNDEIIQSILDRSKSYPTPLIQIMLTLARRHAELAATCRYPIIRYMSETSIIISLTYLDGKEFPLLAAWNTDCLRFFKKDKMATAEEWAKIQ